MEAIQRRKLFKGGNYMRKYGIQYKYKASKNKTKRKLFKCKHCDFEIVGKSALKTHIEHVHEGIKPFKYNSCDYKTVKKFILKKHIKSVHEGIKPFKCNKCEFKTAQNLI